MHIKDPISIEEQQHYGLSHKQMGKALMASLQRRCTLPLLKREINEFNIHIERQFSGLKRTVFEKALYALLSRHENLRTVFVHVNGEIRQKLLDVEACMENYIFNDLSLCGRQADKSQKLVKELLNTEFDFFKEPPFKATCIKIGDDDYVVALVVNHIAFDFYSARQIETEFSLLYQAFLTGIPADLVSLPVQIKDFAAWERYVIHEILHGEYKDAWMERLRIALPRYVLRDYIKNRDKFLQNLSYSDSIEEEVRKNFFSVEAQEIERLKGVVHRASAYEGASYRFVLTPEMCAALKKTGVSCRVTFFGVLTAVFFILLYRLSGIRQLVVGLETAIRDSEILANVVGWMGNTVLLRGDIDEEMRLSEFIHTIFKETQEASRYKIFPFEKVLQKLDQPLDAIGALYLNITTYVGTGLRITDFESSHRQNEKPYFDFDCFATVFDNGTEITFRYKTELFDSHQIIYFSRLFQDILIEFISNKELPLSHFKPLLKPTY